MKAYDILYEIESQAFHLSEHLEAPFYITMGKEKYRTLARLFKKNKIKGSESKKIAKQICKGVLGLEGGIKIIVVDADVLEVSTENPEDMFSKDDPAVWG